MTWRRPEGNIKMVLQKVGRGHLLDWSDWR